MPQGGAWLSNEPRIMGSDDARFAGLQASRNGDTHVAGSIQEGQVLAHQYPDSGVLVRLNGEGTPHNLSRITGTTLATDAETLRQALPSDGEPLPFIPMHDEKQQAELEKALHAAAARPEDEKLRLAAKAACAGLAKSGPEPDEKILSEAAGKRTDPADLTADPAVMQIAAQERAATRLQQMERDIVIEKTFGE